MNIPLENEVKNILSKKGISFLDGYHPILQQLYNNTEIFRSHLLSIDDSPKCPPFSQASYWDISPKYRFDILRFDIIRIANNLVWAIGLSLIYLQQVADMKSHYIPTAADSLFWYNVEFGIRLLSSGWDRIALMLDLAYGLNTRTECNLRLVLKQLPQIEPKIINQPNFKHIKAFRDKRLSDLEAGAGKGARHEATHIVSSPTRFLFEFLEAQSGRQVPIPPEMKPKKQVEFLIEHYRFYLSGIENSSKIVAFRWA